MPLDGMTLETLSVSAVKDSLVTSGFLAPYINENDKEPSWDGHIYIYGSKSKKKADFRGRVPAQVKGTEQDDFSKEEITYSMATDDLRNYLIDGGCILFVVYIDHSGDHRKIYYAELTPIKLRQILTTAGNQKQKVVSLKAFPSDANKKATILLNCYQNCRKQDGVTTDKLPSVEELQEQGYLENIVIPVQGFGITDPQEALLTNEVYLYARIRGAAALQPLDMLPKDVHTREDRKVNISVGDDLYYTQCSIVRSATETRLCIGDSFSITYAGPNAPCEIKYKTSSHIRSLAKDLDFILAYINRGEFSIDGISFPFDNGSVKASEFDVGGERNRLKYAKNVVQLLDFLNCSEDLDMSQLSTEDQRNLDRLVRAFVDNVPVSGLKTDLPPICRIKIGPLGFILYFKRCDEHDAGTYRIYDFFKTDFTFMYDDDKGNKLPISMYGALQADDFLELDNIDYDAILPSFKAVRHHYDTYNRANLFLLDMLLACDKATGERHRKILKACDDFSRWIYDAPSDELDDSIKLLNRLQTIKRQRNLSDDERESLYDMAESEKTREDARVGAYLLLEQQTLANRHFKKLPDNIQRQFVQYPIYHFWKAEET